MLGDIPFQQCFESELTEPAPPPPSPREQCRDACAAQLDGCMSMVGQPGGPRPAECVREYRACLLECPA
jgi:hypothetical protein